jgi:hypothetical protein
MIKRGQIALFVAKLIALGVLLTGTFLIVRRIWCP